MKSRKYMNDGIGAEVKRDKGGFRLWVGMRILGKEDTI